jgi:enoyl-[acyl-carrier protein] reductase II
MDRAWRLLLPVGAEGIQMGTRFVSSKESPVHENWKNAILNGTES